MSPEPVLLQIKPVKGQHGGGAHEPPLVAENLVTVN